MPWAWSPTGNPIVTQVNIPQDTGNRLIQYYPTLLSFTFYPQTKADIGKHVVEVVLIDGIYSSLKSYYSFIVEIVPASNSSGGPGDVFDETKDDPRNSTGIY